VLVGRSLVLPLVNGFLRRLDLVPGRDGLERGGVTWRAARLGPEVPAWVAAIGANDVVSFDGYRTLTRWRLQADVGLARASEVLLGERLAGPLVTVPTDVEGQSFLAGLDSTGQLLLLDDKLKVARTWKMPGTPTAGPLVRRLGEGPYRIGLVIDRTKFLWLDPVRAEPLWVYDTRGQGIAGLPHLDASGRLLVADAGGMIVTLDPSTGEPTGPSWKLTEELVPDATPVPYGPGRLFAPLTDGTVLLLPEP
jgi:hypothetical protein